MNMQCLGKGLGVEGSLGRDADEKEPRWVEKWHA
jgi:hypothetical protein